MQWNWCKPPETIQSHPQPIETIQNHPETTQNNFYQRNPLPLHRQTRYQILPCFSAVDFEHDILINTLLLTCGERKTCSTIKKFQNNMNIIVCKNSFYFLCLYLQLSLSKTVIFGWNLLYLSKKGPKPNLKGFRYQIWTLVKGSGK